MASTNTTILALIFIITVFIVQLIQMYPMGEQRKFINPNNKRQIRSDFNIRKVLIEKLSSNNNNVNEKCNATIISSKRLLIPNKCSPNNNQNDLFHIFIDNNFVVERKGKTLIKLERSQTSLVELNETIPMFTNNNNNNNNNRQDFHNEEGEILLNNVELDGRQFYPSTMITSSMIAPAPIASIMPILPPPYPIGIAYEFEFFEYQYCQPLHIEISVCELCVWMPTTCPIIF